MLADDPNMEHVISLPTAPLSDSHRNLPVRYRPLYARLLRGAWSVSELEWLLAHHRRLPPVIKALIGEHMQRAKTRGETSA